ncbi:hypothetical protein PFAG_03834 [Plasmodium falciparum Santa Lucia]|uniref:Erythrocyte membrane protein 1 n=1 Tax=Plasmodium falciparum Santa Lucia TaxID=478859 RepID=W7FV54_PLAFA|nr:hypothetical protein PFAG_03834 [Plasmodium falciparum Santa Lucia]
MGRSGGGDDIEDGTTNHLLDSIGKIVHDQMKKEAEQRSNGDLKGSLTSATILRETAGTDKPCNLIKDKRDKLAARGDPCGKDGTGKEHRFSKERVAEYDEKKIRDSNKSKGGNNEGECAPYRRLSLCKKNMEKIPTSSTKHDLLLDVCLAAKHEGNSITLNYPKYDEQYPGSGSGSTTCTMLARSFADIGDIIRGKDLYHGKKKRGQTETEREKLEKNLKKIFGNIYNELTTSTSVKKSAEAKKHYEDGAPEFYKLREDWWEENRETVWKAITCDAPDDSKYFRGTCGSGRDARRAPSHCRCENKTGEPQDQVPTYFDYVPQYLRWFEEWAEDFCRKKNKKLKDAKNKCREGQDQSGGERYCDFNGYDCKGTFRGINMYRWDHKCTGCFLSCSHFRTWIDNQKEQFHKQRNKYQNEISVGGGRKKRSTGSSSSSSYDNGYEKKFYDKLQSNGYGSVETFLEKLSKEDVCTKFSEDEGTIDFKSVKSSSTSGDGDGSNKTFSHTTYCQACPLCGVERNGGGGNTKWKRKENMDECPPINLYKPKGSEVGTPINFLYSGDEPTEIAKNLKAFCKTQNGSVPTVVTTGGSVAGGGGASDSQDLYQKWTCYHVKQLEKEIKTNGVNDPDYEKDVTTGGGLCILEKTNGEENGKKQKTFNPFFYYWVVHMLKDSIHWRTEKLDKCINNSNESKACKNNNKCKDNCDCFQRWVKQKKDEWKPIKEHFRKQEGIVQQHGPIKLTHDAVLQTLLKKDLLLQIIQDVHGDTDDIERIGKMLDDDAAAVAAAIAGGENNTTIDKLLEQELKEAEDCLQKQNDCNNKSERENTGGGRIGQPRSPDPKKGESEDHGPDDDDDDDEESDSEEQDANGDQQEPAKDTTVDGETAKESEATETQPAVVPAATTTTPEVTPACDIVDKLFTTTETLKEACPTKYEKGREKFPNWKCVPTTKTTGSETARSRTARSAPESGSNSDKNGAICIPPRRRRLYVGKLEQWANKHNTDKSQAGEASQVQDAASTSTSQTSLLRDAQVELLKAFVESAAVETFFLWHRYKKEWEQKNKPQNGLGGAVGGLDTLDGSKLNLGGDDSDPQKKLQESGTIPLPFLRQMFYTLADYKDILFSGDKGEKSGVKDIITGDKEMEQREKTIKDAIERVLKNGDSQPPSDKTPQQTWWDKNGEAIWNGMICALTYKTDTPSGQTPEHIEKVKEAFFGKDDKPKQNGTYKEKYDYQKVELEQNSGTDGPRSNSLTSTSGDPINNPKLSDFVLRPTYFRYLEEWGETFCKERMKRLKQIKEDCKVDKGARGVQKCSGFGEDCEDQLGDDPTNVSDLKCSTCAGHCRKYRKWIEKKKDEYDKQKSAYEQQKNAYTAQQKTGAESNKDDNEFSRTLGTCTDVGHFLEKLKSGSCKKDSGNENRRDNEKDILNFSQPKETFKQAHNCRPCSQFKIKCENCNSSDGGTKVECNGSNGKKNGSAYITASDIKNGGDSTQEVTMLVSDKFTTKFDGLKEACDGADIFKGFRKEQWECGNFCGYVVCKPKNVSGKANGKNQIITIRGLVAHWVQNFLEDYNRIKHRISHCMEKGEPSNCINGCNKKCNCVKKWISTKKQEWQQIKKQYLEQYKDKGESYPTKTVLEEFKERPVLNKAIKPCGNFDRFETSCGLNDADSSQKKGAKDNDLVLCMIKKLEKKISECKNQHSDKTQTTCGEKSPAHVEEDEEDLLLEEEENTVAQPNICPTEKPAQQEEGEGTCGGEEEDDKKEKGDEEEPENRGVEKLQPQIEPEHKEQPETPAVPSTPAAPRPQPSDNTSDILATTIPFGIALALTSIVFLFLKKKTKSSVGNLFQILQIPKGDHDIPTKLSPNRYIPYDVPNDYSSGDIPFNTQPNTLYFDNNQEKPFITSIHDRNLYTGEEYSYNVNMVNNDNIPINRDNNPYSGIDLINDSLNSNKVDIYDELLKRKENELFGTEHHPKHTNIYNVAKPARDDPITNQINLFHKWLDRHRDMCEKWDTNNKVDILNQLKEEWENDNSNSGNKTSGNITPTSDIPSGKLSDIPSTNKMLNSDVSIQIHIDKPNQVDDNIYLDTYPDKYTVDNINPVDTHTNPNLVGNINPVDQNSNLTFPSNPNPAYDNIYIDHNNEDLPSKVQIEMSVKNGEMAKEK